MVEKSLLIISGSHDLVDMTGRILERAGFEVRCADGLKSAHACFATKVATDKN